MLSSKSLRVYREMSGYERAALRKFIDSPYHNARADLGLFFEYLQEQMRLKERGDWRRESAYAYVYGSAAFEEAKMRYLQTFFQEILEDFLVQRQLREDEQLRNRLLVRAYRQLGLHQHLDYAHQRAQERLRRQERRDAGYWRAEYELEDVAHYLQQALGREKSRSLQPLGDALDLQYCGERLRLACIMQAQQSVTKTQYAQPLLESVLKLVKERADWQELAVVGLYYRYYRAMTEQAEASRGHFAEFKRLLLLSTHQFELMEMRNLYVLAINYGIRRINVELSYLRETFELYTSGLAHGFLLEGGKLSRFSFKNIVTLGLHLKEFDWVRAFIDEKSHLLSAEYQQTYTHYCLSKWLFVQKQYDAALQRLQQVEYEDIFLNIDAKVMQLKIYYETDEQELLESFLSTFRVFLGRKKKVLAYHAENYKNILRFVHRLLRLNAYSRADCEKLRAKILSARTLTEREWLLTQLDQIRR